MEKHNFTYTAYNSQDNTKIIIVFMGRTKQDGINVEELDELAEKVFSAKDYNFIEQIVTFVRTIYKDLQEDGLYISKFDNDGNLKERVIYQRDKGIKYYLYNVRVNNRLLNVSFNEKGFSIFDSFLEKLNLSNYHANEEIIKFITEQLKRIYSLSNLTSVELGRDKNIVMLLSGIYKNFYGEELDFAKKRMPEVINNIMSILMNLKICYIPGNDYYFEYDSILKEQYSNDLIFLMNRLIPLGKIKDIDDYSLLTYYDDKDISKIRLIGKMVREESNKLNLGMEEVLKYLASACYIRNMFGNFEDEFLIKSSCIPIEYFDFFRQLIEKIDNVIEQKDVYSYRLKQ